MQNDKIYLCLSPVTGKGRYLCAKIGRHTPMESHRKDKNAWIM